MPTGILSIVMAAVRASRAISIVVGVADVVVAVGKFVPGVYVATEFIVFLMAIVSSLVFVLSLVITRNITVIVTTAIGVTEHRVRSATI